MNLIPLPAFQDDLWLLHDGERAVETALATRNPFGPSRTDRPAMHAILVTRPPRGTPTAGRDRTNEYQR